MPQPLCDRCRAYLDADRAALVVRHGPLRRHFGVLTLCAGCQADLLAWLALGFDRAAELSESPLTSSSC